VHLIPGRFAIALGFSTAAHVGLAWMVGDQLPSTAAPAQRALTVAMVPAAPRAVLNSIAPTAVAALSPTLVRPLAPPSVAVIDEPDSVLAARVSDAVEALAALPVEVRRVAATPARKSVEGETGSGAHARSPRAVAGQPGANREARPASGNNPPEYPWTARLQGYQGRVVLSVWVSAEGQADRLAVLRSSGYPSLDRAAVAAVQGWRFQPARRAGYDTGSLLYVPVVFRLDGG